MPTGTRSSIRCCANGSPARRSEPTYLGFGIPLARPSHVKCHRIGLFVGLMALGAAPHAKAQSEGNFALGGEFTTWMAGDRDVHGHVSPGLLWRIGHGTPGWGFHWGLNWFTTDVDRSIGGVSIRFGELHVRPFMAGYGYTYMV